MLIEDYVKEAAVIRDKDFKVSNYNIIVDKTSLDPKSCIVFNKEVTRNNVSQDYILQSMGYTVDSLSHTHGMCIRKEFLFPNLKKLGFSVPSLFIKCLPPSKYFVQYYCSKNLMLSIHESNNGTLEPTYSTGIDGEKLGCLLIYYSFGSPVATTKLLINGKESYVISAFPTDNKPLLYKLNSYFNSVRVVYKKEEVENRALYSMVDSIKYINPADIKCGTKTLADIPKILGSQTCELVITQEHVGGKEYRLIDVSVSHHPVTKDIVGEDRFMRMVRRRFYISKSGGKNIDVV